MNPTARGISEDCCPSGSPARIRARARMLAGKESCWVVTTAAGRCIQSPHPAPKPTRPLRGVGALIATYLALLVVMTAGAAALKAT